MIKKALNQELHIVITTAIVFLFLFLEPAIRSTLKFKLANTKTTAAQNEVMLSYHSVCRLYFLAVVFVRRLKQFI